MRQHVHSKRTWSDEEKAEYLKLYDEQKKAERERRIALGDKYKGPVKPSSKQIDERIREVQRRMAIKYGKVLDKFGKSGIIELGSDTVALELQRYGRNKDTLVNKTYIDSGEYRRKFDNATDNEAVNKTLYDSAKTALKHRSGTAYEDMYWIDEDTGKVIHSVTDSTDERAIIYTENIKKAIKNKDNIITLHTHPSSMPPSISDFNSCYRNNYKKGFIACHDGKVFAYTSEQEISEELYNAYIRRFIYDGNDEFSAQLKALEKLKEIHSIDFWEVSI